MILTQKLPVIEAIQYEGHLCIKLKDLWIALHNFFNSAQMWEIDIYVLDDIPNKSMKEWNLFSKQELIDAIEKCNNLSALGTDKLIWSHIKIIIRDKDCLSKLIDITNTCIDLGYWPSHFKLSTMVIIPKPNKTIRFIQIVINWLFFWIWLENFLRKWLETVFNSTLSPTISFIKAS